MLFFTFLYCCGLVLVWSDLVWFDLVCCGLVWPGLVCCGLVWSGLLWFALVLVCFALILLWFYSAFALLIFYCTVLLCRDVLCRVITLLSCAVCESKILIFDFVLILIPVNLFSLTSVYDHANGFAATVDDKILRLQNLRGGSKQSEQQR